MIGDVTLDNQVEVSDAVLLARYLNSDASAKVMDQGLVNAEVNGDGTVDGSDLTDILRIIAKIIEV